MSSSLNIIESLLNEFYQPTTPNARKREIESELLTFKSQSDAWQLCLRVVVSPEQNEFLWFFCSSTLEHAITRRWSQFSLDERSLLRQTLWHTYANLETSVNLQKRQRDTYAQLIALIGKRQFPDEDFNYMRHCIELIKNKFSLGINLLRVTSEELVSNRDDVSTEKKKYFNSCLSVCIPEVMDVITKFVIIGVCNLHGNDIHSIPNNLIDYSLITSLPNDNQLSSSLLDLLACVQHLVSWISIDLISEYFLMGILDLSQWRIHYQDISFAALAVINEMLYLQKQLPHPEIIMTGVNRLIEQHNALRHGCSEMYTDKLRELLRLYAIKYWPKIITNNELLEAFLKLLFCCTVTKNGALDFTEKLEIWTPIIKGLLTSSKLHRYNDVMHQLVAEILRRIQFQYNKSELELLENEILEDGTQTEWQHYLTQCIDCIALIAESYPNVVFSQVYAQWSRPHIYLTSISDDIDSRMYIELTRKVKCNSFNEHLRDFSTLCQAVVHIIPLLEPGSINFSPEINRYLTAVTDSLFFTLKFLGSNKLTDLNVDKSMFQTDLDNLHAQILLAIRSIFTTTSCASDSKLNEMIYSLFNSLGDIFLQTSHSLKTPIIYLAASQLLLCLTTVIRSGCLMEVSAIKNLMQAGLKLSHLPKQVAVNIHISLISLLVLPWRNLDEKQQCFGRRSVLLQEYVESLAQNFLEIDLDVVDACSESKVSAITVHLLSVLSPVLDFFKDSNNTTKDMLVATFKPIATKSLMIYSKIELSKSVEDVVTEFCLSMLRSLQNQLGTLFIKDMMSLFIATSSRDQLSITRLTVFEKILQMSKLVVEQPGNASLCLLPSILDFSINQVLPLLQQQNNMVDATDLNSFLYLLFDSVLMNKWQYFYKSYVQHNGSLHNSSSENMHTDQFISIMNAYGNMLVSGNDPNIVHTILLSMQNVNNRWRLFQRPLFKDRLLASFQSAIIKVLFSDETPIHIDLLTNVLFEMGQVETFHLRESFVNAGFPRDSKVIDDICFSTDIPTFSQKIMQLIQDAHCASLT